MANVGTGATGTTLIGTGSGVSPTFASIGTSSGLTAHGVVIAEGSGAFAATAAGSAGQVLQSAGAAADPVYSTATYPATTTINQILYSSAANTVTGLATANNGVLITSAAGVPSLLAAGTTGQVLTATTGSPPSWANPATSGTVTSVSVVSANGFAGTVATATTTPAITLTTTATGVLSGNGTAITGSAITQFDVLVGGASNAVSSVGPGTSGQILQSGGGAANPAYSTSTYPSTNAINTLLYASSANVMSALAAGNNGVLISSATGVPSWLADGTTGQVLTATTGSPPTWTTLAPGGVTSVTGTANQILASPTTGAVVLSLIGPYTPATYTAHGVLVGEGTSSIVAIAPTANTGAVLQNNSGADPTYSTATYPSTTTINQVLYSSAANTVGGITAANNGVLISGTTGIPSWLANSGTAGFVLTANSGAPPSWQAASGGSGITTINGDTGSITGSTVTIKAGVSTQNSGSSVQFVNSGTTSTLNVTDAHANTIIGLSSGNASLSTGRNTSLGSGNFASLTTGSDNVAIGNSALAVFNGSTCTAVGSGALAAQTGLSANTAIGYYALHASVGGANNTAVGYQALVSNNSSNNTAVGNNSLSLSTSGSSNSTLGAATLISCTSGINNVAIGFSAGSNYTSSESNNLLILNLGVIGESNIIRIGTQGTGAGQQNTCYVAGITGATPVSGNTPQVVLCDNAGNLAPISSSTSGFVLTSNGSATPSFQAASGSATVWTDEATSFAAAASNGYFITAGSVIATLPASPSQGNTVHFIVDTTSSFEILANTGQTIRTGSAVSASAGNATSNARGDSITLVYRSSDTSWLSSSVLGTWTLT